MFAGHVETVVGPVVFAAKIPAEGDLRDEVEQIRKASPEQTAQAEAALQLVQNRIRYLMLAMGTGGLVPADAADTWSRRYGDCKAKTALPASSTRRRPNLPARPSSIQRRPWRGPILRLPSCKGEAEKAEAMLAKALEIDPRNAVVYRTRGLMAKNRKDYQAAVDAFTTAIELEPSSEFAYSRRAAMLMATGNIGEALRISPGSADAIHARARLYSANEEMDKAIEDTANVN